MKKCRKKSVLVLFLVIAMFAFTACGGGADTQTPPEDQPSAAAVKTGFAVMTIADKSANAGGEDGLAQAYSNLIGVTVDEEGVITNCVIDAAQTNINFSKEGKIVTPLNTVFVGKQELGPDYGMAKASAIGKEWNEQAAASDADLAASVTVHIAPFETNIEKAATSAK